MRARTEERRHGEDRRKDGMSRDSRQIVGAIQHLEAAVISAIEKSCRPSSDGLGHFSMHVTKVLYPPKETLMPPIDSTPDLELASSSVRGQITVVNPRLPNGSRVTAVAWSTDDETELPLEPAPDGTVKDETGADVLDPVDGQPLLTFSVYANTPLTPAEGTKADGVVTVSASGMASCTKKVIYGDAPLGHFTMIATEAPEA